jgi:hypothetical protein
MEMDKADGHLALVGLCIASIGPLLAIAALVAVVLRVWR